MKKIHAFALSDVINQDEYCTNALEREIFYLTDFSVDKMLAGFYETAGLESKETRYGGWESTLIGGHTVGHFLSAAAMAYANAGVCKEDKEKLYQMTTELVDGMELCQKNSKGKEGFLFAAKILDEKNVEIQFDHVEANQTNIMTHAWVPWYTMHKILAGLMDVYNHTGYEGALRVARGIGAWTYNRASSWDDATHKTVLSIEYGGINDALYELYQATKEERYAITAHFFDDEAFYKHITSGDCDTLNNHHANTTIPKFIGALNRYISVNGKTIDGEKVDASAFLEYVKIFWDLVVERHTYITGANSEWEHFGKDYVLDAERTNCNNETCNVYNMLKLSRKLFEVTGDKKYADYYENAYYNSILSSQNPITGMTTYFQPMATGYFKVYSNPWDKFWCCTGSGMENFTKLDDSIYFHDEDTLYVNLYESSTVNWKEKGATLTLLATLPEQDKVCITLSQTDDAKPYSLALRLPDWLSKEALICINGNPFSYEKKNGYAMIPAEYTKQSSITLTLPMNITAHPLKDNLSSVGFKYGPVVLSADLGTENMTTTMTRVIVTIPEEKVRGYDNITLPKGVTKEAFMGQLDDYFVRDEEEDLVSFRLKGTDLMFSTHYRRYEERYGIYFYLREENELVENNEEGLTTIDTVQPGYGQYESDDLHQMQDNGSVGITNDGTYRYALAGGSFTYQMAVDMDANNYLSVTLRSADNQKSLKITSGDVVIYSKTLEHSVNEEFYELILPIPKEAAQKASMVQLNDHTYHMIPLTFSGCEKEESARVCSFLYTKK